MSGYQLCLVRFQYRAGVASNSGSRQRLKTLCEMVFSVLIVVCSSILNTSSVIADVEQSVAESVSTVPTQPVETGKPAESLPVSEKQENPAVAGGAEEAQDDGPGLRSTALADEEKRKLLRAKAWAGLVALAGILIAGAMLILFVLIGARRLKRLNRRPLPQQHRIPEYWFINKSPPLELSHPPKDPAQQTLPMGTNSGGLENSSPPMLEDDRPTPPENGASSQ